jgi:cyclopropane fatty-acyl-phospholipid synthase-like methyltransferase
MKKNTSWGGVAKWYDSLLEKDSDSFQQNVILPHLTRLLDLRPSETVLDIACGQGFFFQNFCS